MLQVNPSDHIQQQLFWYGFYEKKYILTWESLVAKNSFVLDIGSNIGYYALVAASKAVQGKVIAFEPAPATHLQLLENIKLNAIKNIRPELLAVGDQAGERVFFTSDDGNSGMAGFIKPGNTPGNEIRVQSVRLDEWFITNAIPRLDLVKIDIEGAELGALSGMRSLLEQFHPVLMIEVQDALLKRFGHSKEDVFSFLAELNYKAFLITSPTERIAVDKPMEDDLVLFI